jgi:hypothetical protein
MPIFDGRVQLAAPALDVRAGDTKFSAGFLLLLSTPILLQEPKPILVLILL